MLKQSLLILAASILVIFFARELNVIIVLLANAHHFVAAELGKLFANGTIGSIVRRAIALFIIPFIVALIPTLIYWAVTRTEFKYFAHIFWTAWIILAVLVVAK